MFSKLLIRDPQTLQADAVKANQEWFDSLGTHKGQRANAIDALFRERSKSVRAT
jgi:hypothetical protein